MGETEGKEGRKEGRKGQRRDRGIWATSLIRLVEKLERRGEESRERERERERGLLLYGNCPLEEPRRKEERKEGRNEGGEGRGRVE